VAGAIFSTFIWSENCRAGQYVELTEEPDNDNGGYYSALKITDRGWDWIEANEQQFILHRGDGPKGPKTFPKRTEGDEIPF